MATYVIGDIHNSLKKFDEMIKLISPTTQDQIMDLPLHIEIDIGSEKYLLAHAMTFAPLYREQEETMYLEGIAEMQKYWQYGIKGYVSLIGHHDSGYQYNNPYGSYLDDKLNSIWVNEPENVYMVDCGCGLPNGRLACIC